MVPENADFIDSVMGLNPALRGPSSGRVFNFGKRADGSLIGCAVTATGRAVSDTPKGESVSRRESLVIPDRIQPENLCSASGSAWLCVGRVASEKARKVAIQSAYTDPSIPQGASSSMRGITNKLVKEWSRMIDSGLLKERRYYGSRSKS